jgi:hypothetical protein
LTIITTLLAATLQLLAHAASPPRFFLVVDSSRRLHRRRDIALGETGRGPVRAAAGVKPRVVARVDQARHFVGRSGAPAVLEQLRRPVFDRDPAAADLEGDVFLRGGAARGADMRGSERSRSCSGKVWGGAFDPMIFVL